jgi:hypothetical protein
MKNKTFFIYLDLYSVGQNNRYFTYEFARLQKKSAYLTIFYLIYNIAIHILVNIYLGTKYCHIFIVYVL